MKTELANHLDNEPSINKAASSQEEEKNINEHKNMYFLDV